MSLSPERKKKIGNDLVEEFWWAGKYVVYNNNGLVEDKTFEQVCDELEQKLSAKEE